MPLALKNKLCGNTGTITSSCEKIEVTTIDDYHKRYVQGPQYNELEMDLGDDIESLMACHEWFRSMIRINIGVFKDIMPVSINDFIVTFDIKEVNFNAGNWTDWFIQDEMYIDGRT